MGLTAKSDMRSSWMRVASNLVTGTLIGVRRGETQTQRRSHVDTEAETRGMWPHSQGHLEPPRS